MNKLTKKSEGNINHKSLELKLLLLTEADQNHAPKGHSKQGGGRKRKNKTQILHKDVTTKSISYSKRDNTSYWSYTDMGHNRNPQPVANHPKHAQKGEISLKKGTHGFP